MLRVKFFFETHSAVLAAVPHLLSDEWEIVDINLENVHKTEIQLKMPDGIAQPLEAGDRSWDDFKRIVERRYGALNYAVVKTLNPARMILSTNELS